MSSLGLPAGASSSRVAREPAGTPGAQHVLVVDNYDSFTYNIVQYLGELGARVTVWRNDSFGVNDVVDLAPDRIVISPGPCTPSQAGMSVKVVRDLGHRVPLLGVCLGHQAVGAAYGANVVRATRIMHGKTSQIQHDGTGVFQGLPQPVTATRYHSLVVEDVPDELVVNATVEEDGGPVVMGLRHREHPVWGVQFHPESVLTQSGHAMLRNFMEL